MSATPHPQFYHKLNLASVVVKVITILQIVGLRPVPFAIKPIIEDEVAGDGPSLFGRNWWCYIKLDWKKIHAVSKSTKLTDLLHDNSHLLVQGGVGRDAAL